MIACLLPYVVDHMFISDSFLPKSTSVGSSLFDTFPETNVYHHWQRICKLSSNELAVSDGHNPIHPSESIGPFGRNA